MRLLGFGEKKQALPTVIKDPFKKNTIEGISVHVSKNFHGKYYAWGYVEFQNGMTKGKQEFKGDTFDDVMSQIKAMLDNLD